MKIPDSFRRAQRAIFQDKTIAHHPAVDSTDALGGKYKGPTEAPKASYTGVNVQVLSDALAAQEYGLRLGMDVLLTCADPLCIPAGDYVQWGAGMYRITAVLQHDSHIRLLGKRVDP